MSVHILTIDHILVQNKTSQKMRKVRYYYLCVWFSRESEPIGYIYIYTYVYIHICVCVCVCVCWGVGGFPGGSAGKESAFNVRDLDSILGLGKSREGNRFRILQYSEELLGLYSPWGHKESDMAE